MTVVIRYPQSIILILLLPCYCLDYYELCLQLMSNQVAIGVLVVDIMVVSR